VLGVGLTHTLQRGDRAFSELPDGKGLEGLAELSAIPAMFFILR
jgi:hypothetical protein